MLKRSLCPKTPIMGMLKPQYGDNQFGPRWIPRKELGSLKCNYEDAQETSYC